MMLHCIHLFRVNNMMADEVYKFVTLFITISLSSTSEISSIRHKRNVLFPSGSGMGIYLAIALPVDLPTYEISLSYNFEANYLLPTNATELAVGPQYTEIRKARDITRKRVYSLIEDRLESEGLMGQACLLRTICETAASPIFGHNGLIGDLLHIIFTPSSTHAEDLPSIYDEAEKAGIGGREECASVYSDCPLDLYDLFTIWHH